MPYAFAIGIPYETFKHLNPAKLRSFLKGYQIRRRMQDEEAWMQWGNYGYSAFQTVMANFSAGLAGKKSSAKYIEKPLYAESIQEADLTQEEADQKELQKMLLYEEQWRKVHLKHGLKEVKIL